MMQTGPSHQWPPIALALIDFVMIPHTGRRLAFDYLSGQSRLAWLHDESAYTVIDGRIMFTGPGNVEGSLVCKLGGFDEQD